MEKETQFFKIPEIPKENSKKDLEKNKEKSDYQTQYFEVPEQLKEKSKEELILEPETIVISKEEMEKIKNEIEIQEKAKKEKGQFLEKMEEEEQKMIGGILRKITEVSPRLKRAIMILATAGIVLSGGKAFAGSERWYKSHQEWQKINKSFIEWGLQWAKPPEIDYQKQKMERQRFEAYQEYKIRNEAIQREYERRKFDIMIGRAPGATDYFSKQRAYQELEQWRNYELHRARYEWSLKVWAIEEAYRMESQYKKY